MFSNNDGSTSHLTDDHQLYILHVTIVAFKRRQENLNQAIYFSTDNVRMAHYQLKMSPKEGGKMGPSFAAYQHLFLLTSENITQTDGPASTSS